LKLNASGVMPIIFAQAIMFIPAAVAGLSKSDTSQSIVGAL
jgi:preprotein translocase subunit SecY